MLFSPGLVVLLAVAVFIAVPLLSLWDEKKKTETSYLSASIALAQKNEARCHHCENDSSESPLHKVVDEEGEHWVCEQCSKSSS